MNFLQRLYADLKQLEEKRVQSEKEAALSQLADPDRAPDLLDRMSEAEILEMRDGWEMNALIEEAIFGYQLTERRYSVAHPICDSPLRSFNYDACFAFELMRQLEQIGFKVRQRRPIRKRWRYAVGLVACEADWWPVALSRAALIAMKRRRAAMREQ